MKHGGKSRKAALRLIKWTLVFLLLISGAGIAATLVGSLIAFLASTLIFVWVIFALFTLYFFRDPNPQVPMEPNVILAPAHGKVDVIDQTDEPDFMVGPCRRVSIFLSVFDVHVQQAPVAGRVAYYRYRQGQFMNALKSDCAKFNENLLLGFESSERPGEKLAVRLIAGLIARRIVPWVTEGDEPIRGERISLIQFGSRVDLYLPLHARIAIQVGDRVVGGETIVARYE